VLLSILIYIKTLCVLIKANENRKTGVLGVLDDNNNMIAVVYHKEDIRTQVFYKTVKCGMEEIEDLMTVLVDYNNNSELQ